MPDKCIQQSIPSLQSSGDAFYAPLISTPGFFEWAWKTFDFDTADWDQGFGHDAPADVTRPR
jgi:hypothetical protein